MATPPSVATATVAATHSPPGVVYAAKRDDESERVARLLELYRHGSNNWLSAFLLGTMYARQVNAGNVIYDMTVEHSRRVVQELERMRRTTTPRNTPQRPKLILRKRRSAS